MSEKILTTLGLKEFYEQFRDGIKLSDLIVDNYFNKLTVKTNTYINDFSTTRQTPTVIIKLSNNGSGSAILTFDFYNIKYNGKGEDGENGGAKKGPRGYVSYDLAKKNQFEQTCLSLNGTTLNINPITVSYDQENGHNYESGENTSGVSGITIEESETDYNYNPTNLNDTNINYHYWSYNDDDGKFTEKNKGKDNIK